MEDSSLHELSDEDEWWDVGETPPLPFSSSIHVFLHVHSLFCKVHLGRTPTADDILVIQRDRVIIDATSKAKAMGIHPFSTRPSQARAMLKGIGSVVHTFIKDGGSYSAPYRAVVDGAMAAILQWEEERSASHAPLTHSLRRVGMAGCAFQLVMGGDAGDGLDPQDALHSLKSAVEAAIGFSVSMGCAHSYAESRLITLPPHRQDLITDATHPSHHPDTTHSVIQSREAPISLLPGCSPTNRIHSLLIQSGIHTLHDMTTHSPFDLQSLLSISHAHAERLISFATCSYRASTQRLIGSSHPSAIHSYIQFPEIKEVACAGESLVRLLRGVVDEICERVTRRIQAYGDTASTVSLTMYHRETQIAGPPCFPF